MRILTQITAPFPGEHVAGVQPDLAPQVDGHWNVRLNLYTGRALSHTALEHEQQGRAGRLATRGQMVSAGIVSGLEVSLERGQEIDRPPYYYHVAAGMGLTASGEDVILRRPLRLNVLDVQVCGPAALFSTTGDAPSGGSSSVFVDGSADDVAHVVGASTLGRILQERARTGADDGETTDLPRVGVLLLQPVETEEIDRAETSDPCEQDPQNYAFEDRQLVDGARLLWYVWPTAWRRLPKADRMRRNRIAYTIFDAEQARGPEDLLPWERVGVPLALVAFNRRWKPLFADRNAVARAGGKPRSRTLVIANAGTPFLWQARLQQFAEHIADIDVPRLARPQWDGGQFDRPSYAEAALSREFRFLPPAGILPRAILDIDTRRQTFVQSFFPSTFRVDALPIPLEQLDAAIEGSAPLAPFDTFAPDEVQILVPVPQAWFEPNLLKQEVVSPEFFETIDAFVRRRGKWLFRRLVVRQRKAVIERALDGREEFFPDVDPGALDAGEAIATAQTDPTDPELAQPENDFGTSDDGVDMVSAALTRLRAYLSDQTPLYNDVSETYFDLERSGIGRGLDERAAELVAGGTPQTEARAKALVEFNDEFRRQLRIVQQRVVLNDKVTYDAARRHLVYTARAEPMNDTEWQELRALSADADYVRAVNTLAGKTQTFIDRTSLLAGVRLAADARLAFAPLSALAPQVSFDRLRRPPAPPPVPSNRAALVVLPFPKSRLADVASGKVWYDEVVKELVFTPRRGGMTIAERDALLTSPPAPLPPPQEISPLARNAVFNQVFLSQPPAYVAAVHGLYERSQQNEVMQLDRLGLRKFIDYLAKKIDAADDKVDLCFARVQADIYRLRQLMLGSNAATRLATSPALASIAKGESAFATQENLQRFIQEAKAIPPIEPEQLPDERTYEPPLITSRLGTTARAFGFDATVVSSLRATASVAGNVFATALLAAREPSGTAAALPVVAPTKEDVVGQTAIVGRPLDFRSITIAERLEQPKAPEVKDSATATKASVIAEIAALGINVDDLEVPGFNLYGDDGKLVVAELRAVDGKVRRVIPKETRHTLFEIMGRRLATEVLQGYHDLDPIDGDESAFFAMSVRALDHAVATLRIVEGRIQAYNTALQRCRQTLAELERFRAEVQARLQVIETELAETRHDVSVSRALLAEETARITGINDRRARIIAEHVPYLAFRRPRSADLLGDAPVRHLDPAAVEPAIPTCLTRRVEAPAELRAMAGLFREVPVRWFTYVSDVVDRLDRIETMRQTLRYAKIRASVQYQARLAPAPDVERAAGVGLGASIQRVVSAHQQVVSRFRAQTAQLDLAELAGQSWQRTRERARDALSLGDLSDADHGRAEVARAAAQELEMISRVAACLYARFGEVAPQVRLAWAQQLSQYDDPVNLRNLASLPRWDAIEYLDRRELQGLTDWLFERVEPREPQALALMSDLVRLCILLASHAPVNEIVAGHVHQPTAVQPGGRVELTVDLAKVHVGMQVLLYGDQSTGPEVIARAVVEDLGDGKAAARVVQATHPTVSLGQNARAQFVEPDHPDLTAVQDLRAETKAGPSSKPGALAGALVGRW